MLAALLRAYSSISASVVALAKSPCGLITQSLHAGAVRNRVALLIASRMTATSKSVPSRPGSMSGASKGLAEFTVTEPRETGVNTAVEIVRKLPATSA